MLGNSRVPPDDDTLVVFGIHHFGVGDVRDGKEVPGGWREAEVEGCSAMLPQHGDPRCTRSIPTHGHICFSTLRPRVLRALGHPARGLL